MREIHDEAFGPRHRGFVGDHLPHLLACGAIAMLSLLFFALTLPADAWEPGRGGSLVAIPAVAATMVMSALTFVASVLCPVVLYLRHRRLQAVLGEP